MMTKSQLKSQAAKAKADAAEIRRLHAIVENEVSDAVDSFTRAANNVRKMVAQGGGNFAAKGAKLLGVKLAYKNVAPATRRNLDAWANRA